MRLLLFSLFLITLAFSVADAAVVDRIRVVTQSGIVGSGSSSQRNFSTPAASTGICLTPGCIYVASLILQTANLSADPCNNFYQFSCGKYLDGVMVSDGDDDGLTTLRDEIAFSDNAMDIIENTVQKLFLKTAATEFFPMSTAHVNTINYYKACLGYNANDSLYDLNGVTKYIDSTKFVLTVAKNFGGFTFSTKQLIAANSKISKWNLEQLLASSLDYNATLSSPVFLMFVGRDMFNPAINSLKIHPPLATFYFGDQSLFQNMTSDYIEVLKANFYQFLIGFATSILPNPADLLEANDELINRLVDFEVRLANITPAMNVSALEYELGYDDQANVTIAQLVQICPAINWTSLLQIIGRRYRVAALTSGDPSTLLSMKVTLFSVSYFRNLSALLSDSTMTSTRGKVTLQNYLALYSLASYFNRLSPSYVSLYRNLTSSVLTSSVAADLSTSNITAEYCMSRTERKHECLDETKSYFGHVLSKIFVDKFFDKNEKAFLLEMAETMRQTFISKTLPKASWVDDELRARLEKKASEMLFSVGHPDDLANWTALDRYYADYGTLLPDDYLGNLLKVWNGTGKASFKLLDKPAKRVVWTDMYAMDMNAENDQCGNVVIFPAANAMEPYFRLDFPKAFLWGGIGASVFAHEINHAFDPTGINFGDQGEALIGSWSDNETVLAEYEERLQCLVDQFAVIQPYPKTLPGVFLNGQQTLIENFADNGGMSLGYDTFQAAMGSSIRDVELPGLALTNEQVYFLAVGMTYCGKQTKASQITSLEDSHSPDQIRVNAMMKNLPAFANSFSCPESSPMNPTKKCQIW